MPKRGDFGVRVRPDDWILITKSDGVCQAGRWVAVKDPFGDLGVESPIPDPQDGGCYMLGNSLTNLSIGEHGEPDAPNWMYMIEQLVCEGAL